MNRREFFKAAAAATSLTMLGLATKSWAQSEPIYVPSGQHASEHIPVYLTMDDGYQHVDQVLADTRTLGIPVTFFPAGQALEEHPAAWQALYNDGHEFGCHTFSHPQCSHLSVDAFRHELDQFKKAASNVLGHEAVAQLQYFRFPYGDTGGHRSAEFRRVVREEYGWHVVGWDVSLDDVFPHHSSPRRSPEDFGRALVHWAKPDDIFLMHFVRPDAFSLRALHDMGALHGLQFLPLSSYPPRDRWGGVAG